MPRNPSDPQLDIFEHSRPAPPRDPAAETVSLDDWAPGQRPSRARKTDPESSHIAVDRIERSGKLRGQLAEVLQLVRAWPGLSARQLSELTTLDRYQVARRLPDLRARGLVISGAKPGDELRWFPTFKTEGRTI